MDLEPYRFRDLCLRLWVSGLGLRVLAEGSYDHPGLCEDFPIPYAARKHPTLNLDCLACTYRVDSRQVMFPGLRAHAKGQWFQPHEYGISPNASPS